MLYQPYGKLNGSTAARGDIRQLFQSVYLEHCHKGGDYRFRIWTEDFQKLMICQEVVDYYRVGDGPTEQLALLDRMRERQADGKQNIFFGWPMSLYDFKWPPSLEVNGVIVLHLSEYL